MMQPRTFRRALAATTVLSLGVIAALPGSAHGLTLDVSGKALRFGYDGQTVEDAANLSVDVPKGTALAYRNVLTVGTTTVDAVVTYFDDTNVDGARIDKTFADSDSAAEANYIEARLGTGTALPEGFVVYTISFYEGGTYTGPSTGTPIDVAGIKLNIYDIDDLQKVEVSGLLGYSVATNTHLTVTPLSAGAYSVVSPDTQTESDDGTSYTVGRFKGVYATTSSITVKMISPQDESASFDLDFSNGVAWSDQSGGGEDRTKLPPSLPPTGANLIALVLIGIAAAASGAVLVRVRSVHA